VVLAGLVVAVVSGGRLGLLTGTVVAKRATVVVVVDPGAGEGEECSPKKVVPCAEPVPPVSAEIGRCPISSIIVSATTVTTNAAAIPTTSGVRRFQAGRRPGGPE
jgi:hypothetical protein